GRSKTQAQSQSDSSYAADDAETKLYDRRSPAAGANSEVPVLRSARDTAKPFSHLPLSSQGEGRVRSRRAQRRPDVGTKLQLRPRTLVLLPKRPAFCARSAMPLRAKRPLPPRHPQAALRDDVALDL